MRVIADLATNDILQITPTPEVGVLEPINGKYIFPVPEGAIVDATPSSYIVNAGVIDAGSIVTQAFASLLSQFPQYDHIIFNPLIVATDADDLDPTLGLPGTPPALPRGTFGRATPGPQSGLAPNSIAVFPPNNLVVPPSPSALVTNTIDLTLPPPAGAGLPGGAREFMVYWKIFKVQLTADISSSFGATAGLNTPAIRSIEEVDQEPALFEVQLSPDDGVTFFAVNRFEPITFCTPVTLLRLGFKNETTDTIFIAHYSLFL